MITGEKQIKNLKKQIRLVVWRKTKTGALDHPGWLCFKFRFNQSRSRAIIWTFQEWKWFLDMAAVRRCHVCPIVAIVLLKSLSQEGRAFRVWHITEFIGKFNHRTDSNSKKAERKFQTWRITQVISRTLRRGYKCYRRTQPKNTVEEAHRKSVVEEPHR